MWRKIIDDYRLLYLNDLFEINLIFYGLCRMFQLPQFVWATLFGMRRLYQFSPYRRYSISKISSDQKCFFIALSLYPLFIFANTPFKANLHIFLKTLFGSVTGFCEFGLVKVKFFYLQIIEVKIKILSNVIYLCHNKKISPPPQNKYIFAIVCIFFV